MMYGVPLVQESPQQIFGMFDGQFPNRNAIPLVSMDAVDRFATRHWHSQNDVPTEFGGTFPATVLNTFDAVGFAGIDGLSASKFVPPMVDEINLQEREPIRREVVVGVILTGAVLLLGSVAIWAYSKFK